MHINDTSNATINTAFFLTSRTRIPNATILREDCMVYVQRRGDTQMMSGWRLSSEREGR